MADVFRHNGYRTGLFGKWHLGTDYPYRPIDRGFDEWLGHGDGGAAEEGALHTRPGTPVSAGPDVRGAVE
jgi:arylsulfatase A-like enzyme